jgi:hypothetical protein
MFQNSRNKTDICTKCIPSKFVLFFIYTVIERVSD